ncbi:hypothetical protein JYT44_02515 [Caldithrix abyssi]|nr:hypothetical protein [Caldithrix abyssi]
MLYKVCPQVVAQSIKGSAFLTSDMNPECLTRKINQLQKTVWDIDEKSKRNLESVSKQQLDIAEVKNSLALLKDKIEKLWIDLNKLKRSKGGASHGTKHNYRGRDY